MVVVNRPRAEAEWLAGAEYTIANSATFFLPAAQVSRSRFRQLAP